MCFTLSSFYHACQLLCDIHRFCIYYFSYVVIQPCSQHSFKKSYFMERKALCGSTSIPLMLNCRCCKSCCSDHPYEFLLHILKSGKQNTEFKNAPCPSVPPDGHASVHQFHPISISCAFQWITCFLEKTLVFSVANLEYWLFFYEESIIWNIGFDIQYWIYSIGHLRHSNLTRRD